MSFLYALWAVTTGLTLIVVLYMTILMAADSADEAFRKFLERFK